jgi:hypothetical protein
MDSSGRSPFGPSLVFESKRDGWVIGLFTAVSVIALVAVGAAPAAARGEGGPKAFAILASLWPIALGLWLLRTTRYEIASDALRVRCGPLCFAVPFAEIEEVRTKRGLSPELGWSLSFSLDRLLVRRRGLLPLAISPEPREPFLSALAARCPHLARDGDRLRPTPS